MVKIESWTDLGLKKVYNWMASTLNDIKYNKSRVNF